MPSTLGYVSLSASSWSIHNNFLFYLNVLAQHLHFLDADVLKLSKLTW